MSVATFRRSLAFLVAIDDYQHGVAPLSTPVGDARAVGNLLAERHGYEVHGLYDAEATLDAMRALFEATIPAAVGPEDRVIVYFAGHGIALDGEDGPEGFLVPQDARPEQRASLLAMKRVHDALDALPCRHLLLLLDCCFAGSFRWATTRSFKPATRKLSRWRYDRFISEPAWQVITSAAYDQEASDVIGGLRANHRDIDPKARHSPFALSLLEGLRGAADARGSDGKGDGIITSSELYIFVRDQVELAAQRSRPQTPGIWPLRKHGRGEFVFEAPTEDASWAPDPVLDEASNPWRGLSAYGEGDTELYFGRGEVVAALCARVSAPREEAGPLVAVMAASGAGKSSVLRAGLIAWAARQPTPWTVVGPLRPGAEPGRVLAEARAALEASPEGAERLLVIDQGEELFTLCRSREAREGFLKELEALLEAPGLRVVFAARAEFEPQLAASAIGHRLERARFTLPPPTLQELREIAEGPAGVRVMVFEPAELVDTLVSQVAGTAGGLPLLSFTLSEMYRRSVARRAGDRALTQADYEAVGGVLGSLRSRATELLAQASPEEQGTLRRVMLRMVAAERGEIARRAVSLTELTFADPAENARVRAVVDRFTDARLLVRSLDPSDGSAWIEPAHDALVLGWDRIHTWLDEGLGAVLLQRAVWEAARAWERSGRDLGLLWDGDPRLPQAAALGQGELNALEAAFIASSRAREAATRRRRRVIIGGVGAVLAGALAVSLTLWGEAEEARVEATEQAVRADAQAERAEAEAVAARDALRMAAVRELGGEPDAQLAVLREIEDPRRARGYRQAAVDALAEPLLKRLSPSPHPPPPEGRAALAGFGLSATGERLLTFDRLGRGAVHDLTAASSPRPFNLPDPDTLVPLARFDPEGRRAVLASETGIVVVDLGGQAPVRRVPSPGGRPLEDFDVLDRGPWVAVMVHGEGLALLDTGDAGDAGGGQAPRWLDAPPASEGSYPLVRAGPGGLLAARHADGLRVYQVDDAGHGREVAHAPGGGAPLAFSPDGKRLLTDEAGALRLWSVEAEGLRPSADRLGPTPDFGSFAFSPGGQILAVGVEEAVRIHHLGRPRPRGGARVDDEARDPGAEGPPMRLVEASELELGGHTGGVRWVGFRRDGTALLSVDAAGMLRLWHLPSPGAIGPRVSGTLLRASLPLRGDEHEAPLVAWSQTDEVLTLSASGAVRLRRAPEAALDAARVFPTLDLSPRGDLVAFTAFVGSPDDPSTVALLWPLDGATFPRPALSPDLPRPHRIQFLPDGAHLVSTHADGRVRVSDLEGRLLRTLPGSSPAWSADGRVIATVEAGRVMVARTLEAEVEPWVTPVRDAQVNAEGVLLSSDGRWVAVCGTNLRLLRVGVDATAEGIEVETCRDAHVAFRPDGAALAVWDEQANALRLWELPGGADRLGAPRTWSLLTGGPGATSNARISFHPTDGRLLLARGDGSLTLIETASEGDPAPLRVEIPGPPLHIRDARFSRHGHHLILSGAEGLTLLPATPPHEPLTFRGLHTGLDLAEITSDRQWLVVSVMAGGLRRLPLDPALDDLMARVEAATVHCLDAEDRATLLSEPEATARARAEACQARAAPMGQPPW